ncbi:MAG: ABC transporter permease [Anaerolineales bacterium]|nr:ABC transporter permease [Anaerolineales bacterium]
MSYIKFSRSRILGWLVSPIAILFLIIAWKVLTIVGNYPIFILPPPDVVARRLLLVLLDGSLLVHTGQTLKVILLGLGLGLTTATILGYGLAKSSFLENLLSPYIIASQAIPIIALAPLIFIWFGPGLFSDVLVTALIVFFPILVNTIVGVRSVPAELADLMRMYRATRWQTFTKLELPAALPVLLGGFKIGATLAVVGAIVAEFVRPSAGLGYLILTGKNRFDTDLVFVALFTLVVIALSFYGFVSLIERRLLSWHGRSSIGLNK